MAKKEVKCCCSRIKGSEMLNSKKEIIVCMGSSCFARGNAQNLEFIENYINEKNLNATVELAGSRCEGKCADGPNIIIDGVEYNNVNEEKIKEIMESLQVE